MYCASETCPHAWSDSVEQKCYDCEFMVEAGKPQQEEQEEQEDCPGQLFFNFFSPSPL